MQGPLGQTAQQRREAGSWVESAPGVDQDPRAVGCRKSN